MVDAEAPVKTRSKRAAASLKTLDATLFLEALMDAMESGKRPQAEAALHAIRVFIDGVMTLACDSAVVGVSEEDAADARAAVAAAEAAMKAEAEAKAAAEKARKEGKNPPSDEGASGEDADMQKVPEAKEEETKKEEEKEPKTTRSSKRGASSSKKSAKTDEEEEGEENDKADKEETSDKNKKAPEKEAGSERAAADAARATAAAAAAAALHAPCLPPCARSSPSCSRGHALLLPEELAVHRRRRRGHRRALPRPSHLRPSRAPSQDSPCIAPRTLVASPARRCGGSRGD